MLARDLPWDQFRTTLRTEGRVVVPDVLEADAADRLRACLERDLPWELAYRDLRHSPEHQAQRLTQEEFRALGPARQAALQAQIHGQAREHFQYLYQHFRIDEGRRTGQPPGLYVYDFLDFLESEAFLAPARALTGDRAINHVFAHATLYTAGSFLKAHEDVVANADRRYAYVLGLTRGWQADMGGLLHFLDDQDRVTATAMPGFNTLTVFSVPARHLVSAVAPWVRTPRFAITGWLMVR